MNEKTRIFLIHIERNLFKKPVYLWTAYNDLSLHYWGSIVYTLQGGKN